MDAASRLRLRARSVDDLSVIAALTQDAIVPIGDIAYLEPERCFVLALNRYRWEDDVDDDARARVHAGLRFDNVNRVRYRYLDLKDRSRFLSLLTMTYDDGVATLHFSGGATIRLEVDSLKAALEDLDEPWPTQWEPKHETE